MQTTYPHEQSPTYVCLPDRIGQGTCWSVPTLYVDATVVKAVLATMVPDEIDLSLSVVHEVERQVQVVDRQWKLRVERARYEADRAQRQYDAVEPENRLVARTLEAQWNEKLRDLEQIEREYEETRRARKLALTAEDRQAMTALARDLPRIWQAATTTDEERKRILRLLLEDLVLTPIETPTRGTQIRVLWKTGATQELVAPRPRRDEAFKTPDAVVAAIHELAAKNLTDGQIAETLNERGLHSGHGCPFCAKLVSALRRALKIQSNRGWNPDHPLAAQDERGRYSINGLAARYEVTVEIVRNWIHQKVITPDREPPYGTRWLEITPEVDSRIQAQIRSGYGPRGTKQRAPRAGSSSPRAQTTAAASKRARKEKNQ